MKKNTNNLWAGKFLRLHICWLFCLSVFIPAQVSANQVFLTASEKNFLEAEKSFSKNQKQTYQRLKSKLENYPLYAYLEYREVLRDLGNTNKVESFFAKYPGSYLAEKLHTQMLHYLASKGKWSNYLNIYNNEQKEALRCYAARATLAQHGVTAKLKEDATSLWLQGNSVDDACDPLFKTLISRGVITEKMRWQRIGLAMEKNKHSLARYLAKKLPAHGQTQFRLWSDMHRFPAKTLTRAVKWKDTKRNRQIMVHGIKRYSREDTVKAWRQWHDHFKPAFEFSDALISDVETSLVLRAAWRHLPEAAEWFQLIPDELLNEEAREWRVRSTAREGNWGLVDQFIDLLPEDQRQKEEWRYWKARANDHLGNEDVAQEIYRELASNTSYYGFLVSDILNQGYTITHEPVISEAAAQDVATLESQPAFRRIKALYELGRDGAAYAEWKFEIGKMPKQQKRVAAQLASNWKKHFTAIVTTAQAGHFSDLDLRFPLLFEKFVSREAKRRNVRPSLVYGVIRRESAYREEAVSPAGALGLMQVMPATAKHLTRKLGIKRLSKKQLKKARHNIMLGTFYLRRVLDKYDNNEILATASYNAGPHRVKKWLPEESALDADVWVDSITFDETRKYVKAVHFYSTIFDWKSDGKVDYRLKDRMRLINPAADQTLTASNR